MTNTDSRGHQPCYNPAAPTGSAAPCRFSTRAPSSLSQRRPGDWFLLSWRVVPGCGPTPPSLTAPQLTSALCDGQTGLKSFRLRVSLQIRFLAFFVGFSVLSPLSHHAYVNWSKTFVIFVGFLFGCFTLFLSLWLFLVFFVGFSVLSPLSHHAYVNWSKTFVMWWTRVRPHTALSHGPPVNQRLV